MSLWGNYTSESNYPKLQNNLEVDTLIIGGGMTGLNTLYFLKNREQVCLVEANTIGTGVSQNTTGKINYLQENTIFSLWKSGKIDQAISYLKSQLYGMEILLDIIRKEHISCDLEQVTSYLVTQKEDKVSSLKKFKTFLEGQGISITDDCSLLDKSFLYGIGVENTYVFHPVKYMDALAKKLRRKQIYENTKIIKIVKGENQYYCHTDAGYCIRAKKVVVACHYPFFLFPFFLPLKSSVEKSYLVACKVSENLKYTYITLESPSLSTRFYQDGDEVYQIYLGSSHDITTKQNDEAHFYEVFEQFSINSKDVVAKWSNVDLLTEDHIPYVGELQANLYFAGAYQTWGIIQSVLSAEILSYQINQMTHDYSSLFEPKRMNFSQLLQYPICGFKNAKSFLMSKYYPKSWYSNQLQFSFSNGKILATYEDESGAHTVHPVCPHMKCSLIFNEIEKTWDCPCHSSRFDLDGNCIKGPAKFSISVLRDSREE